MKRYGIYKMYNKKTMLYLLIIYLSAGCFSDSSENKTEQEWTGKTVVIPAPRKILEREGAFILDNNVRLSADLSDSKQKSLVSFAIKELKNTIGYTLKVADRYRTGTKTSSINFILEPGKFEGEAYEILIDPTSINIKASAVAGLFYGFQTIVQLIKSNAGFPTLRIPALSITDYPELIHRAVSVEQIDQDPETWSSAFSLMAGLKLNTLLINIKSLVSLDPDIVTELTTRGEEYHIRVIPYITSPDLPSSAIKKMLSLKVDQIVATNTTSYAKLVTQLPTGHSIWLTTNELSSASWNDEVTEAKWSTLLFQISLTDLTDIANLESILQHQTTDEKMYNGIVLSLPFLAIDHLSSLALTSSLGWRDLNAKDLEKTLTDINSFLQ